MKFQTVNTKLQFWQKGVVLFLMLYFTNFMSYREFTGFPRGFVFIVAYSVMALLLAKQTYLNGTTMSKTVNLVVLSFLLSCIPSILIFGQSVYDSLGGILMFVFPMSLYYILHRWNVEERLVFKYLMIFTAVFGFFEVIQQFTYPTYWFNGRAADEYSGLLEQRMGFWRFYLFGIGYCLLAIMLCFGKILKKEGKTIYNYGMFIICAIAIYFFLARKDIYAVVSCIAIGTLFYSKRGGNTGSKIFIGILLVGIYFFLSNAMVDLNAQTQTEMGEGNEDFIRFVAADYFINSFSDSPLYYVFGSGVPGGKNYLASQISYLIDNMHIYQDDCGFVGYFSRFGLFGVLMQIIILYKICVNYKYLDMSLLMFALLQVEISFFDFWGNNARNLAAWAIFLYLVDKNIQKNKQIKINNGKNFR